jgi:ABC-2 type transport system ATP-binding protein
MIDIQNLHFSYKRKKVFDSLNLQFTPGHVYGLLGRNGTGKSTLLRNIAGLLFPKKGSILVDGNVPGLRQPKFLQNIFMVPEEFYLPNISISDFLKHLSPFYSKFNHSQFEQYTRLFDVPSDSTLQHMSYGQKKKVLISFALASNAKFLLMDEPTNGLDIISKSQFRKVLAEALDEDRCIIISTHQVKDLENLIDRITIIDEGKILFDQTVEDISKKLSFRLSFDDTETKEAFYSESSLRGNAIVTVNDTGDESKVDLELLYKAIVTNADKVKLAFKS